jgi:hypothetical protein
MAKVGKRIVKGPSPERVATTRMRRNQPFVGRGEPTGPVDSDIRCHCGDRSDQQPVVAALITV